MNIEELIAYCRLKGMMVLRTKQDSLVNPVLCKLPWHDTDCYCLDIDNGRTSTMIIYYACGDKLQVGETTTRYEDKRGRHIVSGRPISEIEEKLLEQ